MNLNALEIILGVIILILAIGILVTVSMQHSKKSGLGSVMGGSSDSFYGRNKAKSKEIILKKLTIIFSVALVILALVLYAYHGSDHGSSNNSRPATSTTSTTSTTSATSTASGSASAVSGASEESETSEEPSTATSAEESADKSTEESSEASAA